MQKIYCRFVFPVTLPQNQVSEVKDSLESFFKAVGVKPIKIECNSGSLDILIQFWDGVIQPLLDPWTGGFMSASGAAFYLWFTDTFSKFRTKMKDEPSSLLSESTSTSEMVKMVGNLVISQKPNRDIPQSGISQSDVIFNALRSQIEKDKSRFEEQKQVLKIVQLYRDSAGNLTSSFSIESETETTIQKEGVEWIFKNGHLVEMTKIQKIINRQIAQ
jgi:hypothetical protein